MDPAKLDALQLEAEVFESELYFCKVPEDIFRCDIIRYIYMYNFYFLFVFFMNLIRAIYYLFT